MDAQQASSESRPRGLHFVADVLNRPANADSWLELTHAHRGSLLADRVFDPDRMVEAISRVREIVETRDPHEAAHRISAILQTRGTELGQTDDGRWTLRPRLDPTDSAAETFRAIAAFALGEWLSDRGRCAWGVCAREDCDRVFIDAGRRQPQRFCGDTCATRDRVMQHRRRRRGDISGRADSPGAP